MPTPPPRREPTVLWQQLDGRATLYLPADQRVHTLNESATAVWAEIDGVRSPAQLARDVAAAFSADVTQLRPAVDEILATFSRLGLLEEAHERERVSMVTSIGDVSVKLTVPARSAAEDLLDLVTTNDAIRSSSTDIELVVSESRAEAGLWHLERDGIRIVEDRSLHLVEKRLLLEWNDVVRTQQGHLAIHAGVVAVGRDAVALAGPSGAGKSTTVAAAVKAGFDYVSDEALLIDWENGDAIPYPKPVALDRAAEQLLGLADGLHTELGPDHSGVTPADRASDGERHVQPAELGGRRTPHRRLRLAAVVALLSTIGERPAVEPLHRADVAAVILRSSFNHHADPVAAFELAHQLAMRTPGWSLLLGPPDDSVTMLKDTLAAADALTTA